MTGAAREHPWPAIWRVLNSWKHVLLFRPHAFDPTQSLHRTHKTLRVPSNIVRYYVGTMKILCVRVILWYRVRAHGSNDYIIYTSSCTTGTFRGGLACNTCNSATDIRWPSLRSLHRPTHSWCLTRSPILCLQEDVTRGCAAEKPVARSLYSWTDDDNNLLLVIILLYNILSLISVGHNNNNGDVWIITCLWFAFVRCVSSASVIDIDDRYRHNNILEKLNFQGSAMATVPI